MSAWPVLAVGLRLRGEPVLVVGGGAVAAEKIDKLRRCGADLTVVAPQACAAVQALAAAGELRWWARPFAADDVRDRLLVVSATGRDGVDLEVYAACRARRILCNSADVPEACSAWLMAQHQEGPLTLAVGTSGTAPGLTRRLLAEARAGLPAEVAAAIERYAALRRWVIDELAPGPAQLPARMALLRGLAQAPWSWFGQGRDAQQAALRQRRAEDQPR